MIDDVERQVASHYAQDGLERRILDALAASGKALDSLVPSDLSPVDEFHSGGRQATVELAAEMDLAPGMHVLDVGCGIGGPSRHFAEAFGCRVTGIDLTEDYVRTAAALARRVGLGDRVSYKCASALDLPFAPGTFDGAYMMHVGMNIADKPRLFSGIRRVLKAGASFAVYDVMMAGSGELRFPVHWASTPDASFVAPPAVYRQALRQSGFEVRQERDCGHFLKALGQEIRRREAEGDPMPPLGTHILLNSDVAQKLANLVSNVERGLIAPFVFACGAI